jgi:hypothetical protein
MRPCAAAVFVLKVKDRRQLLIGQTVAGFAGYSDVSELVNVLNSKLVET